MAKGQGFASMSRKRRKEIAAMGGTKSNKLGKAYKYTPLAAKAASVQAVIARKRKAALMAAKRLLAAGFTAEQLAATSLSTDEYIYFGGGHTSKVRLLELIARMTNGKTDIIDGEFPSWDGASVGADQTDQCGSAEESSESGEGTVDDWVE